MVRLICQFCCVYLQLLWISAAHGAAPTTEQLQFFEREIRPLLAKNCYECHSGRAKKLQASLRLDSRAGMLRGGDSGAVIVPGKPAESLLMGAVRYEDYEMPPRGKLKDREIAALKKWIFAGAPWPDEPEPGDLVPEQVFDWKRRQAEHWCWQPIEFSQPPPVQDTDWPSTAIDQFVLAKLEANGLSPAQDADRRTLSRNNRTVE